MRLSPSTIHSVEPKTRERAITLSYGTLQSQMELTPAYLSLDGSLDHDINMTLLL